jgi:hypothetical protein
LRFTTTTMSFCGHNYVALSYRAEMWQPFKLELPQRSGK